MIDSHCHLDFWTDSEIDDVVSRASLNGVDIIQTISTRISQFSRIEDIASKFDFVYCSIGNHPDHVHEEQAIEARDIVNLVNDSKVRQKIIGIGETGLDYYRSAEYATLQQEQFREHIISASILQKPVIVHTRSADDDTLAIISEMQKSYEFTTLIHCFTGSMPFLTKLLDLNCYISYSGIVTFKNAQDILECAKFTPIDRIIVETDAPFLAPVPMRGKKNEPAFVKYTSDFLAHAKSVEPKEFERITSDNFLKIFDIKNDNQH